ncbi:Ankyrin repeat and Fbox domain containing protein [Acanthamoeba castellanii str. Neff]|uniref:Ankyrin repeat and Fbox domain containing protein n=1 Tax=Acanthamoeba castellanii (strain ATCC 30010 / Neff) TaxID=1257118 RepID=L8GU21_ACACF|nr:Ankyrin repeat and Fbox domain containing protein [Acanthamoeba castellanii str. Neff]ELR16452.1 Ankyrin repeat and Fbox domain containing protein [Acanthamoeba castellanii str. Neff]
MKALVVVHEVLPVEVMQHVLGMLDVPDLIRAEVVCSAWCGIAESAWHSFDSASVAPPPPPPTAAKRLAVLRRTDTTNEARLNRLIRWCCATGHDRVLQELLATERDRISPGMLNSTGTAGGKQPKGKEDRKQVGITPMHLAASCGSADVIRLLIQAGADVDPLCGSANTPVGLAVTNGFLDAAEVNYIFAWIRNKVLLLHGAKGSGVAGLVNPRQKNSKTKTKRVKGPLFFQAAAGGHVKIMQLLVEQAGEKGPALPVSAEKNTGRLATHFAAEYGRVEALDYLLQQGVDKDAFCRSKRTALHAATVSDQPAAVRFLLDQGAKVHFTSADVRSRLPIPSPLHQAAEAHNEVLVRLFLEFGVDINQREEGGRTPLHAAMDHGPASPRFTRLLLDLGADATAVDDRGQTVFHYLFNQPVKSATVEVCQCLIDAGADPVLGDPFRRLRFFGLAQEGIEVIRLLKQHGVEVDGPDVGSRLLSTAAQNSKFVLELIDLGVEPSSDAERAHLLRLALNRVRWTTSLGQAASSEDDRLINRLLERGMPRFRTPRPDPALFSVNLNMASYLELLPETKQWLAFLIEMPRKWIRGQRTSGQVAELLEFVESLGISLSGF